MVLLSVHLGSVFADITTEIASLFCGKGAIRLTGSIGIELGRGRVLS